MKSQIGDLIAGLFLLAVLFMLVRPGSPAVALVTALTSTFDNLLALATTG